MSLSLLVDRTVVVQLIQLEIPPQYTHTQQLQQQQQHH